MKDATIRLVCEHDCSIVQTGKIYRCSHYIWSIHKYRISGSAIDVSKFEDKAVSDALDPLMPWGKYRDNHLSELPNDYLLWLLEKAEQNDLTPIYLNDLVIEEWKKRKTNPTTS